MINNGEISSPLFKNMAKTISGPHLIDTIENVPVYLTYKTVKNINIRIVKDRVSISAPSNFTIEEVLNIIDKDQLSRKLKDLTNNSSKETENIDSIFEFKPINEYPVKFITTSRKKLRSEIKNDQIYIYGPKSTSLEELQTFYSTLKTTLLSEKKTLKKVLLFGKILPIEYKDEPGKSITLYEDKLVVPTSIRDQEDQEESLDLFIIKKLQDFIDKRIKYWISKTGLTPNSYRIRKMKTRWGSCTYNTRTIRFNFYLAMLPKACIDSVIIHELVHLKIPNHKEEFFSLLRKYCPNYDFLHQKIQDFKNVENYLMYA